MIDFKNLFRSDGASDDKDGASFFSNILNSDYGYLVAIAFGLVVVAPVFFTSILVLFDSKTNNDFSFWNSLGSNFRLSFLISLVGVFVVIFYFLQKLQAGPPKQKNVIAFQRWTPVFRNKESVKTLPKSQEEFFAKAPIDTSKPIPVGGSPINKISNTEILYEKDPVHDLTFGSTRSGKSRKIVRPSVVLYSQAGESMIFNDPKKEMYQDFHLYLEKKGYDVYCLDFRNPQYSHCWNPLADITYMFESGHPDDADQYASDQVSALVVDNGKSEAIWIDGQKALIKSLILEVCQAPISRNKKNYYSVYQMMNLLGGEEKIDSKSKMLLSAYMESLDESSQSRVAFTPISTSPDRTRGSFMTTALATLNPFTPVKLSKILSKCDFDLHDFTEGKKAVFVVNPDEKDTYNGITAMFFDAVYQAAIFEANKLPGRALKKRMHVILDEFGNMPKINRLESKITVALSRKVLFHLFLQDNKQMVNIYGQDIAGTIRSNCNLQYFISSADLDTLEEMSKKFGEEDIYVDSSSDNYSDKGRVTGGGSSYGHQARRLIDANSLGKHNGAETGELFVYRTYLGPCKVYLPDCSEYSWYNEMQHDETEIENTNLSRSFAVPRYFILSEEEIKMTVMPVEEPSTDIGIDARRNPFASKSPHASRGLSGGLGGLGGMSSQLSQKNMYWYWSTRNDIQKNVKDFVLNAIKVSNNPNFDVRDFTKSDLFINFIHSLDNVLDENMMVNSKGSNVMDIFNTMTGESTSERDVPGIITPNIVPHTNVLLDAFGLVEVEDDNHGSQ